MNIIICFSALFLVLFLYVYCNKTDMYSNLFSQIIWALCLRLISYYVLTFFRPASVSEGCKKLLLLVCTFLYHKDNRTDITHEILSGYSFRTHNLFWNMSNWYLMIKVMVFCYQNCSDLLWEKIVLVIEKKNLNSKLKIFDIARTIYAGKVRK